MVTRIKICGITRPGDAQEAARLGAAAIGLMFADASPRRVSLERAQEIARALPPFVTLVGVFVDPPAAAVERVLAGLRLHLLQFHGDEAPEFCAGFGIDYVKAARVRPGLDLLQYAARYAGAKALLLDAFVEGVHGGTGTGFDLGLVPGKLPLPVILSGGLAPGNVGAAVRRLRPWAVDVSSGVEAAKGIKDAAKVAAFIREVRDADA